MIETRFVVFVVLGAVKLDVPPDHLIDSGITGCRIVGSPPSFSPKSLVSLFGSLWPSLFAHYRLHRRRNVSGPH